MTATDGTIDSLFEAALRADRNLRTRDEIAAWLADPSSRYPVSKVHDWRNHIPDVVWDAWDELLLESRLIAFIQAAGDAHAEEWE